MRFISGFILGVLLTIAVAYVHNSAIAPAMAGPDPTATRMVNWDVVSHSFNRLVADTRDQFDRLIGRPAPAPTKGV